MNRPTLPGLPDLTVNTIFCIGRNYVAHAKELNNPLPQEPVIFTKPVTSLVFDGGRIVIPPITGDVHHELEMVAAIGKSGKNIPEDGALDWVAGYAPGLDMTARDIQGRLKENAHPWDVAKGLDTFAPLGEFVPASDIPDPADVALQLTKNGEVVQQGVTELMIFKLSFLISYLSARFTLNPGDLIYTGTPEGVGPVRSGDVLEASLNGNQSRFSVSVS